MRLVYIDPPFNTGEAFRNYDDALEHSVWLTMLRDRLVQIKPLLSETGSVWVHLDDSEQHMGRSVLDEVFGRSCFVTTVIWQEADLTGQQSSLFISARLHPRLRTPGSSMEGLRNKLPDEGTYSNPDNDPNGPWRSIPINAQAGHATASQFYKVKTPTGKLLGSCPRVALGPTRLDRFDQLVAKGRVYWPKQGNGRPRLKRYPGESDGLVPFTVWTAAEVGENNTAKQEQQALFPDIEPFATPKPEGLIARIVGTTTNPGDIVLDCFAGSGTTAAVAHKLERRWVTMESLPETVATYTLPRLEKVVAGLDRGGISAVTVLEVDLDLPASVSSDNLREASRVLRALSKTDAFDSHPEIQREVVQAILRELRRLPE